MCKGPVAVGWELGCDQEIESQKTGAGLGGEAHTAYNPDLTSH